MSKFRTHPHLWWLVLNVSFRQPKTPWEERVSVGPRWLTCGKESQWDNLWGRESQWDRLNGWSVKKRISGGRSVEKRISGEPKWPTCGNSLWMVPFPSRGPELASVHKQAGANKHTCVHPSLLLTVTGWLAAWQSRCWSKPWNHELK